MTTNSLDQLAEAAEAAETKAARAAETAAKARAEAEAAKEERRRRHTATVDAFETERRSTYPRAFGSQIHKARKQFENAVREGGNAIAAWVEYRRVRVTVAREYELFAYHHAIEHDRRRDEIKRTIGALSSRAQDLLGKPKSERGQYWHDEAALWRADLAAYEGREIIADDPIRAIGLPEGFPAPMMHRMGGLGGPDPEEDNDFNEAFSRVLRAIENEAVEAHEVQRRVDFETYSSTRQ